MLLVERMTILIWDLPLRLFHWLLLMAMVAVYLTGTWGGLWLYWHVRLGEIILGLLTFRIAWGFLGSTPARFHSFFPTPARLRAYFTSTWSGIGHSPLAGVAILLMLLLVLAQIGSGLFANNDDIDFHGPLYDLVSAAWSHRLTSWHHLGINPILFLISLHVLVIGYYTGIKRHNLILPMITGKANIAKPIHLPPSSGGGFVQSLIAISLGALVFWCIDSGALLRWLSGTVFTASQTPLSNSL